MINAGAINEVEINGSGINSVFVTPQTTVLTLLGNIPLTGFFVPSGYNSTLLGSVPSIISGHSATLTAAQLSLLGRVPNSINVYLNGDTLKIIGDIPTFGIITQVPQQVIGRRYFSVMTGIQDGLKDVVVPLSVLTIRQTLGKKSSANISIPAGDIYAAVIQDRPNGKVIIHDVTIYSDESEIDVLSAPFSITTLTSSQGAKSYGINMNLSGEVPNSLAPVKHTVHGVSMISKSANGIMRVRSEPISNIVPGDLVVLPDDSEMHVSKIVKNITSNLVVMEISDG